jgi:hypothetical protein
LTAVGYAGGRWGREQTRGVSDRPKEKGHAVNSVSVGERTLNETRFKIVKARAFCNARTWSLAGGKPLRKDRCYRLAWIKYRVRTNERR